MRRLRQPLLAALLLTSVIAMPSRGSAAPDETLHRAELRPNGSDSLQRLVLPLEVVQASRRDGLTDLRLLDDAEHAVALGWAAAPVDAAQQRSVDLPRFAWPGEETTAGDDSAAGVRVEIADGGRVLRLEDRRGKTGERKTNTAPRRWLLDASAELDRIAERDESPVRLSLDWATVDGGVSARVQLEGSADAKHWTPVTDGALLELPGRDTTAPAVRSLAWPKGASLPRYLRLASDPPLPLRAARLELEHRSAQGLEAETPVVFQPVAASAQAVAHWSLDLRGAVALRQLTLPLDTPGRIVALRIEQRRQADGPWLPVATTVVSRLQRDGREQTSGPIALQAPAARWWRLVPDARTPVDAAAPWAGTIRWAPPMLVFVSSGRPLQLEVGTRAASPALPLAQLMPGWQPGAEYRLPAASLGPLRPVATAKRPWHERLLPSGPQAQRQWLLWAVLALAVLGLGVVAWRLRRDLDARATGAAAGAGAPPADGSGRPPVA